MHVDKVVTPNRRLGEHGSITVMSAILMSFLFLMMSLCIDISRIYMMRSELQNAADAAALTAARELNGGSGGIDDAVARATSGVANAIANNRGFAHTSVNIDAVDIQFAVNLNDDPYMSAAAARLTPTNIRFVKVTTQANSTSIIFAIGTLGSSHAETGKAVAGMSTGLNGICDFFPAAVGLNDADNDPTTGYQGFTPPAVGTNLTLNFNQGTGSSATIADRDYIILEVPDINGNGTGETAVLTAGIPNFCKKLGDNINMTPSSNQNNGPRNSGDGMNTRFNVYAGGYGNALVPASYPPDSNVQENITATQYKNRTAGSVTAPSPNGPGQDDRRMLVAPIIAPGTYPAYTTNILGWGVFFLKSKVPTPNGNCSNTPGCGSIPVEYVGQALLGNAWGDPTADPSLRIAVLYK